MHMNKIIRTSVGTDYVLEQINWDGRRGRFIVPIADLSALVDVPNIRIILLKVI